MLVGRYHSHETDYTSQSCSFNTRLFQYGCSSVCLLSARRYSAYISIHITFYMTY